MEDTWQKIDEAIAQGKTITAIKIYRDRWGAGLQEAASAINDRIKYLIDKEKGQ